MTPPMAEALEGLIERLRSNAPLPLCPFDSRSPLYWTTPDDATCHFCGQLPDGPDRCRGADTRVMDQAADALESALHLLGEAEKALEEIARIRTELRGDFSLSSKQSDIARSALDKIRKGMGVDQDHAPTAGGSGGPESDPQGREGRGAGPG